MSNRALLLVIFLASSAVNAQAKAPGFESWRKGGVSYDQYRADAIGCAKKGYFRDITNDAPAKRFIRSFELADRALNDPGSAGGSWIDHVQITRPDRQKRDLQALHVSDVEKCLLDSGLKKFSLKKARWKF